MRLPADIEKILNESKSLNLPPIHTIPVLEMRERQRNTHINATLDPLLIYKVISTEIPCPDHNIPIRLYLPDSSDQLPCLLYFHGGGWAVNDLDTHDYLCRAIAKNVGCIVVSVGYRKAPENKFPAGLEDGYVALEWVERNHSMFKIKKQKIGIAGDSSGAHMATTICMLARDRKGPQILFQWLVHPVTDYYLPFNNSYNEMGSGYSLSKDFMMWFWENYLPEKYDPLNPYLFPLKSDNLKDLPKTYLVIAHFDPLRDEGMAYGEKLAAAGNDLLMEYVDNQMHGFLLLTRKAPSSNAVFIKLCKKVKVLFDSK